MKKESTSEGKHILDTFGYSNLRGNKKGEKLDEILNVRVCPYCNREYTFTIKFKNKKKLLFNFDHFLSKVEYPYLSTSFFNLIPSCSICNTTFKGYKTFSISSNIHPHFQRFHKDVTFTINPNDITFAEGNPKNKDYDISLKNLNIHPKEEKANEIFKIKEVYNEHKDYVNELIKKFYIYNDAYISDLFNNYNNIFVDKEELKLAVFSNYLTQKDSSKRPLAKLTRDIYNELNDLKNGKIII